MTGFALRAPWYVRERAHTGVRDPAMLRPAIQMYDDPEFVRSLTADPRGSLAFGDDDLWSYPVPVSPTGKGRLRLSTWRLVTTGLRKLYQPSHNRYYAVVVEVFCDEPGLPRAGSHDDIQVGFVMRRQFTPGAGPVNRPAARTLMRKLAKEHGLHLDETVSGLTDLPDLWSADRARRRQFLEDHADKIRQLYIEDREQGWFTKQDGSEGQWLPVPLADPGGPDVVEQQFRMWRLPARDDDCDAARTRSTWFGLIPTYSADHFTLNRRARPKLDSHAIYQLRCFVKQPPAPGKEGCPPKYWWSEAASEPFRLADPMDPAGTAKRLTSITLPDLRHLAASAGKPMGPGGLAITTPPKSALVFNPFDTSKPGAVGNGGVCTFALELFFLVAFFLFLGFLPIVVFLFQLWFLLALRFCIPPSVGLNAVAALLADASVDFSTGVDLTVRGNATLIAELAAQPGHLTPDEAFDQIFGTDSTLLTDKGAWLDKLSGAKDAAGQPVFNQDADLMHAAVISTDPKKAAHVHPPAREPVPPDPLCP